MDNLDKFSFGSKTSGWMGGNSKLQSIRSRDFSRQELPRNPAEQLSSEDERNNRKSARIRDAGPRKRYASDSDSIEDGRRSSRLVDQGPRKRILLSESDFSESPKPQRRAKKNVVRESSEDESEESFAESEIYEDYSVARKKKNKSKKKSSLITMAE